MYGSTFFKRAAKAFHDHPSLTKLLVVCTVSGGGVIAYSDAGRLAANGGDEKKKKKVLILGTGWAATSFLKTIKNPTYEVHVVSPRNYFTFTPLLPTVTNGTVESRSVVESIRNITRRRGLNVDFKEAECFKIDAANNKVHCKSRKEKTIGGGEEFTVDYDYLVVAVGACPNTFNTPGVMENAHFLKEVEDAQRIRRTVINCFEKACLPTLSEQEKKQILNFVVVGGGPAGVEFAAELHDFLVDDLSKLYPSVIKYAKVTLLEAGDNILNMFDKRIAAFAFDKFTRDGINLKTGWMVSKVSDTQVSAKDMKTGETASIPYGMVVWCTGIGTRPVIMDFMKSIGQGHRRVLATDEWLRVEGTNNIFALGDCATINQRRIVEDISAIFGKADKNKSGVLNVKDFVEVYNNIRERYPQLDIYLKKQQLKDIQHLLKNADGSTGKQTVDIDTFKKALSDADSQLKNLPATAQVAAQQGEYLGKCFNRIEECIANPEGPIRVRGEGRHTFMPFRYKHFGQFAPLGGEQAAAELPGDWVSIGQSTQWLWYSVYASKQVSWRTRVSVVGDWIRRYIFGRDSSQI